MTGSAFPCWQSPTDVSPLGHAPRPQRLCERRCGRPRGHSIRWSCRLGHDNSRKGGARAWGRRHGTYSYDYHSDDRFLRGFPREPAEPVLVSLGANALAGARSYHFHPLRHLLWALRLLRAIATKSCAMMHHPTYLWKPASPLYQARFIPN